MKGKGEAWFDDLSVTDAGAEKVFNGGIDTELGAPNLGGFSLTTLMKGLAYVMVPIFGTMMLFMIDSMTPKR